MGPNESRYLRNTDCPCGCPLLLPFVIRAVLSAQPLILLGEAQALSDLYRLQAAIVKADNDTVTAERHLCTALAVARQQGAKLYELRAAIDLAGLWRNRGKTTEAIALLQPVHDSIAEGDCPEDQATARELLAELAT